MSGPDRSNQHDDDYMYYRSLVLDFRMTQLQSLLVFSGQTRSGRKGELQERALQLINLGSKTIYLKIKELAKETPRLTDFAESSGVMASNSESYSNPYTSPIPDSPSPTPPLHQMPTFPDVELKPLPFYDIQCVLLKPCSLIPSSNARFQEQEFKFHLTPAQAAEITSSSYRNELGRPEYRKQIQMRFSLLETSCQQEDNFPQSISVKVNHRLCPLPPVIPTNKPGVEPRRPPKPINITSLCKLTATSANMISVSWAVEVGKSYTISVYFVDNLTYQDLLNRLKEKGERHPDFTKALIKEKLKDQEEIATTTCKVSLACPLGKMRMRLPCRSSTCDHLQTFDAGLFLQMNEKKPKWQCPVCNKPALHQNLLIDGFFMELVKSTRLPVDEHEIVLHNDGTWDPLLPKKDDCSLLAKSDVKASSIQTTTDYIPIDDSDSDDGEGEERVSTNGGVPAVAPTVTNGVKRSLAEVDCITLDSDSDTEASAPNNEVSFNKRLRLTSNDSVAIPNQPPVSPDLIILD